MVNNTTWWLTAALTAALLSITAAQPQSSGGIPTCAEKLAACANYLNATTTPPASCCNPLKEALTKEKECLCNIYNNPALLQAFSINVTQALGLPKLCHIDTGSKSTTGADFCKAAAPSSTSTGSSPSRPGGSGSGSGSSPNAVDRIAGTGLVSSLVLVATYLIFC